MFSCCLLVRACMRIKAFSSDLQATSDCFVAACRENKFVYTVKNDFFGFPKLKRIDQTGEIDKSLYIMHSCQIFSGFKVPKVIKIGKFLTELFKNKRVDAFWGQSLYCFLYNK